jgi:hypothetical protein
LIPTGFVPLDEDYKNLQLNFQQLDTSFGVDHTKFSVTPLNGYHTVVHIVPFSTTATNPPNNQPVAAPPVVSTLGEIFTAQINDGINSDEALYYRSGGGRITQFTRNFTPTNAANGATSLPGGLILNWGQVAQSSSATYPVTFFQPFTTTPYSIVITPIRPGSHPGSTEYAWVIDSSISKTGFTIFNDGSHMFGFNWMAIGT